MYIQYEQIDESTKTSNFIKVKYITKDKQYDQIMTSFSTRHILYHFTDKALVVDGLNGDYPPMITSIIGIK